MAELIVPCQHIRDGAAAHSSVKVVFSLVLENAITGQQTATPSEGTVLLCEQCYEDKALSVSAKFGRGFSVGTKDAV